MDIYKQQAAREAFSLIKKKQAIGFTIGYLVDLIAADSALSATLRISSPAAGTTITQGIWP